LRIGNAGIGTECARTGFGVFYCDPETAECDEYYHLDIRTDRAKVFTIRWLAGGPLEVMTFKRGPWEEYFVS
jgi:hypothetical protein